MNQARRRSRAVVFLLTTSSLCLSLAAASGCVKRDGVAETQPLAANLAAYWTCAVVFTSDGQGEDANEAFTFVPWFESRVRERGVFEPLGRDESAEAEVTLHLEASHGARGVGLRLLVRDTSTKEPLGEVESSAWFEVSAEGGGDAEPRSAVALRAAADRILERLAFKRRTSVSKARHAPREAPAPEPEPVGPGSVCSTQCQVPAASSSSHDEQYRVGAGINATMMELRGCLDRVGAQLVEPAVLLRFAPDGALRHMRVDVGGYEQLDCIRGVRARPLPRVFTSRASLLRCEYRCSSS